MLLNISMKESVNWLWFLFVSIYGNAGTNSVYIGGFLRLFFKII